MRKFDIFPHSIRSRLLLTGLVFTAFALLIATLSINEMLDRFVRRSMNDRLDGQIALVSRAVRANGTIDEAMLRDIAPFTRHERGWGWRIVTPSQTITSRQLLPIDTLRVRPSRRFSDSWTSFPGRPISFESRELYARTLRRNVGKGTVAITAAAPRAFAERQRREAVFPVFACMAGLAAILLFTTMLQLRVGLRPLARLKDALGNVRAGRIRRISTDQPAELREMVAELNRLLDENEAALARARDHVANLAHSLKTPLSTLNIRLSEAGGNPELSSLLAQMDHAIRHHLGRARAASPGAPGTLQLKLGEAAMAVVAALGRIHAERKITIATNIAPELTVKCDPQDLDEMLGNLLDNACKWAASRITIRADKRAGSIAIDIEDDGSGLSDKAIEMAMIPGQRLDEQADGHGFGLHIVRELAELHGGSLRLGRASLGGLCATLILPA